MGSQNPFPFALDSWHHEGVALAHHDTLLGKKVCQAARDHKTVADGAAPADPIDLRKTEKALMFNEFTQPANGTNIKSAVYGSAFFEVEDIN